MKKIMFNSNLGLERAVLNGTKTMTRRFVSKKNIEKCLELTHYQFYGTASPRVPFNFEEDINNEKFERLFRENLLEFSPYKIGELIAIAQPYRSIGITFGDYQDPTFKKKHVAQWGNLKAMKGWDNKMFVRADLMPYQIKITDIKVQRLQEITPDECLKEGVHPAQTGYYTVGNNAIGIGRGFSRTSIFKSPRFAFKVLINTLGNSKTWDKNEYVYAYTFKLIFKKDE